MPRERHLQGIKAHLERFAGLTQKELSWSGWGGIDVRNGVVVALLTYVDDDVRRRIGAEFGDAVCVRQEAISTSIGRPSGTHASSGTGTSSADVAASAPPS